MKAAVLEAIGQPLRIIDVAIPVPVEGQILLKMRSSGICGAQLQEIDGKKGDPSHCPHLLGHEGCGYGYIEGSPVKAVIHWRKGEGADPPPAIFGDIRAGPCTTFSEFVIVSENRVTFVPWEVPDDFACLLGCCLSTALAVVDNEADIQPNETVTIIGCGGVGLALILAARLKTMFVKGVDVCETKRVLVESLGAGFSCKVDYANVIIDTLGLYPEWKQYCRKYISLQKGGSEGGGFNPTRDIPRYVQMWRDGKLRGWEKIITHRISLDQINEGIQLMRDGKAGRVLIEMQ